jgi:uncharacterized membrane protein
MKRLRALHLWFIIAMVASCVASVVTLSHLSIRLDEAQSLWVSTKSVPEILKLISQDVHVPLYELILHFWVQLFGNSILAARLLSFLFFLATLPLLYRLCRAVSSRTVALLAATLFSLSPFIMWYSSEARMYTLFALVTTVNHYFFLKLIQTHGKQGKFGYFFTTVLGLYTHYFFAFLLMTQVVFLLSKQLLQRFLHIEPSEEEIANGVGDGSGRTPDPTSLDSFEGQAALAERTERSEGVRLLDRRGQGNSRQDPRERNVFDWKLIFTVGGVLAAASAFFLPWAIYFLQQGGAANTKPLIPPPTSYNLFQTIINFLFGFQSQGIQSLLISLWPLSVLILFLIFTKRSRTEALYVDYFALATFFPILLVFAASFVHPIFLSRYLILVTPTLFFLIAWLLLSYIKKFAGAIITLLLLGMFGLLLYQNLSTNTPVKEDYSGVSTYLENHAGPSDIIAVSAPFTIYPIEYTYSGVTRITTIPPWDRYNQGAIPAFTMPHLIQQMDTLKQQYDNVYVVLSYDQGYQSDIIKYLDSHFAMVTKKTFSDGLQIREYRLRYNTLSSTSN